MCGIAGIISPQARIDAARVPSMLDAIQHRGPDDHGTWQSESGGVVLGHCRLSILDLTSSGHQPMFSSDGRTVLVFNGEIYNYRELKERFFAGDESFHSTGDTELLLRMWERFGEDCLGHLRGMFAFAVLDQQTQELVLARDPCGIKPLYYAKSGNEFIFASELKGFKALNPKWPVDFEAMGLFLKWGSIPAPKTAYRDIKSLPAGSLIRVSAGTVSEPNSFWNYHEVLLNAHNAPAQIHSREEAVEFVREKSLDSVRAHLVSDEPVGAFLSGGIDSSAVVSLMRKAGQSDIGTFCIGFEDEQYDESSYANSVAELFETRHVCHTMREEDFRGCIDGFFKSMDQPTVDGLNTYIVSKLAHDNGYKVVTSGIGGDEVFGGYRRDFNKLPKLCNLLQKSGAPSRALLRQLIQLGMRTGIAPAYYSRVVNYLSGPPTLARCLDMGRSLFSGSEIEKMFSDSATGQQAAAFNGDPFLPQLDDSLNRRDSVSCFLLSRFLGSQLLRDSDNFSMAFSLELRTPLVDSVYYEALAQIRHESWFLEGDIGKSLFVDAVGDLPRSITHRTKKGFTPPFQKWMQNVSFEMQSGYISEAFYEETLQAYRQGKALWSRVWMLIVLDRFLAS